MKREFEFADGHQTAAASDSASMQGYFAGPAKEISEETITHIRAEALTS